MAINPCSGVTRVTRPFITSRKLGCENRDYTSHSSKQANGVLRIFWCGLPCVSFLSSPAHRSTGFLDSRSQNAVSESRRQALSDSQVTCWMSSEIPRTAERRPCEQGGVVGLKPHTLEEDCPSPSATAKCVSNSHLCRRVGV